MSSICWPIVVAKGGGRQYPFEPNGPRGKKPRDAIIIFQVIALTNNFYAKIFRLTDPEIQ